MSLSGTLKRGAAAAAVGLVLVQVIGITQVLVLGRILGPTEVGLFTAGTVLLGFISVVSQGAMSQALIQRRTDIEQAANTVLVVTFATGLLLALVVAAASPVLGRIFQSDEVTLITLASSGMVLLHACTSVPDALMQRELKIYRKLVIDPTTAATYAVVAIGLALAGLGAWAMVIGTYVSQIVWVTLSWTLARWKPNLRLFSVRIWRELASYSSPLLIDSVCERTRETLIPMLIGRILNPTALGQFRYGERLGSMPAVAILQVCSYLLFPAFAKIAHERDRLVHAYLRALGWLWAAALPIAFVMVMVAEPVIVALLGERWQPAGVAAAALAGLGPGMALSAVGAEAIKGLGRPRVLVWPAFASLVLGVPAVWWMTSHGLVGVAITISATYFIIGVVVLAMAGSIIGIGLRDHLRQVGGSTVAAIGAFVIVGGVHLAFVEHPTLVVAVVESIAYFTIYPMLLAVFDRNRVRVIEIEVKKIGRKLTGRNRNER